MRPTLRSIALAAVCFVLTTTLARAQERPAMIQYGQTEPARGWTFTPSLGVSSVWDDNVLMQGADSHGPADFVSVLAPHAALGFTSARSAFSASYDGAFELYRQFDSLNNYGQFESLTARHRVTPRTNFYVQQELAVTPTTELPLVVGVPYIRMGATLADGKAGLQHAFTKRTSVDLSYDFQVIAFDKDPVLGVVLFGGHGHTGIATLRHQMTAKTSLIADYEVQHATITNGAGTFTVQTARAGAERKMTSSFVVFGEAGLARVSQSSFENGQTAPSWRAGAAREFERFSVEGAYNRSFVPAFGVGDTIESQDVGAHVKATLTHRISADGGFDWLHERPLSQVAIATLGEAPLRSLLVTGLVGYTASPWLRIEGFLSFTRQQIDRPGGQLDRNRFGIQVTTTKPMRVR